jgi:hypothetical protein
MTIHKDMYNNAEALEKLKHAQDRAEAIRREQEIPRKQAFSEDEWSRDFILGRGA